MKSALDPAERALWEKVIETVRPLDRRRMPAADARAAGSSADAAPTEIAVPAVSASGPIARKPAAAQTTLDGGWDRRLARGEVVPDRTIDLHGYSLAGAYDRLDRGLGEAIAAQARVLLLITGHAPRGGLAVRRGVIRAAVGDWLAASRHAAHIAAIRAAHARHGGAGALYIVLRRRRAPPD